MIDYLILWLSVFVFIGVGMLTNLLFFRSVHKKIGRHNGLDSMLFEDSRRK